MSRKSTHVFDPDLLRVYIIRPESFIFFKLIDENIENIIMVKYSANLSGNCWELVDGFQ